MENRTCIECKDNFPLTHFPQVKRRTKYSYRPKCKVCFNRNRRQRYQNPSVEELCTRLLSHAKYQIKKFRRRKRESAAVYNLDLPYLLDLYYKQQGLCAYSDMPLQMAGDWRMSLERVDTTKGYIKGNVLLICQEFQSGVIIRENQETCQWSREKVLEMRKGFPSPTEKEKKGVMEEVANILEPIPPKRILYPPRIFYPKEAETDRNVDKLISLSCFVCGQVLEKSKFSKINKGSWHNLHSSCKQCRNQGRRANLARVLKLFVQMAKDRTKLKKKRNPHFPEASITLEDLVQKYQNQWGRCYYSNVPMALKGKYCISLERLNPSLGYSCENVSLACYEFNLPAQWTPEKFKMFVNYPTNSKKRKFHSE